MSGAGVIHDLVGGALDADVRRLDHPEGGGPLVAGDDGSPEHPESLIRRRFSATVSFARS